MKALSVKPANVGNVESFVARFTGFSRAFGLLYCRNKNKTAKQILSGKVYLFPHNIKDVFGRIYSNLDALASELYSEAFGYYDK